MAKIVVYPNVGRILVTSSASFENIEMLEKFRPKALGLFDEDNIEIFRVATTVGNGSINCYGAEFGGHTQDDEKFATIVLDIPKGTKEPEKYAEEVVGASIISLNKVEAQFAEALEDIERERATVRENITIA